MRAEARLVRKGRDVSLEGLLDQARVHLRLQEEHAADLRRVGWTERHARELVDAIAKVEAALREAVEARIQSKKNLERERAARAKVRSFKRRLILALNDLRASRRIGVTMWKAMKESGGPLYRSTPRMLDYLRSIAKLVEKHDALLAPYFGGKKASAELRAVSQELETAQARQEVGRRELPGKTRKVYLAKARLLGLIEKLNRLASIAFDDESRRRLFDKRLIERATKRRRKALEELPSPTSAQVIRASFGRRIGPRAGLGDRSSGNKKDGA